MDESFPLFRKATLITENFPHINIFPSFFLPFYLFFSPSRPSVSWVKIKYLFSLHLDWKQQTIYVIFCSFPALSRWELAVYEKKDEILKGETMNSPERRRCHGACLTLAWEKVYGSVGGVADCLVTQKLGCLGCKNLKFKSFPGKHDIDCRNLVNFFGIVI